MAVPGNAPRRRWRWFALAVVLLLAAVVGLLISQQPPGPPAAPAPTPQVATPARPAPPVAAEFVGSDSCAGCHSEQHSAWRQSQHHHAMAHAGPDTVLGDFEDARFDYAGVTTLFTRRGERYFVTTDGPDGELEEFEVLYTFGLDPMQQYLVDLGQGRLQALSNVWDTRPAEQGGQRWFHLYPDDEIGHGDPLHWTGAAQHWNFMGADCPDGALEEFEVLYTFGPDPMQQYLVDLGQGRQQALSIVWDTRPAEQGGQRWFHLYPDDEIGHGDPLHWTGAAQNWNFMCADCHVTDYRKGFDADKGSFSPAWSELGVGCEACHGPGSQHLAWAEGEHGLADRGLTVLLDERRGMHWLHELERVTARRSEPLLSDREQQVCAQCHSLRSAVAEGYHAGLPLLDFYRPELLSDPLYFADGQQREEVFITGNFAQSRMHAAGVTCSDCHEPHSQALRAKGNALCGSCHLPSNFDRPEHHQHPADSSGAQCVNCHMPERTYMVIDPRRDHGISIPRPDLGQALGIPDACSSCHSDRSADWAAQQVADRKSTRLNSSHV